MKINSISAFQIYDSRGNPTIECHLTLDGDYTGAGLVPSGASTGQYEALELRDGDPARFGGKSVFKAIKNIHDIISPAIVGVELKSQSELDRRLLELDGTTNKSGLGANAILAVSMAFAKASAAAEGKELYEYLGQGNCLPVPEIQIVGGGAHANWRTDVQDFMVIATGARNYEETLEITSNVYHATAKLFQERGKYYGLADEGGFWPEFDTNEEAFEIFMEGIRRAGYTPGEEASLSLDIAASDLYDEATELYRFGLEDKKFTKAEFLDLMLDWCKRYPIVSIEDPFADTDFENWKAFTAMMGSSIQIIGDDLFTTNPERIRFGIENKLANSVLIKLNQIGTVSETLKAIQLTKDAGWSPVVSARSGETEDAFISHLAVACDGGHLKVGSFARSERMVKWNEVLRIGKHLAGKASFRPFPQQF